MPAHVEGVGEVLTYEEAAERAGVSVRTLSRWVSAGRVHALRAVGHGRERKAWIPAANFEADLAALRRQGVRG